jgi:hypothetical protein
MFLFIVAVYGIAVALGVMWALLGPTAFKVALVVGLVPVYVVAGVTWNREKRRAAAPSLAL